MHSLLIRTQLLIVLWVIAHGVTLAQVQATPKLHILGLGSSFMEDMLYRVPELFPHDTASIDLNFLYISGGSIGDHWKLISSDRPSYKFFHYDNASASWCAETLAFSDVILRYKWDIIILQQCAQLSGQYNTIPHDLNKVLPWLENRFPQALFFWHLSWAFASDSDHPGFSNYDNNQDVMFRKIVNTGYQIMEKDFTGRFAGIIPTGIVIQTLRDSTDIITSRDYTRDGFHLDLGIGRYAAAATFYEAVLSNRLHHSLLDDDIQMAEDPDITTTERDLILQTCYDVVHNDSLIMNLLANDFVYKSLFYNIYGNQLDLSPEPRPYVQQDFYVSGRTNARVIIQKQ